MPKEINLLPKKNLGFFERERTIIIFQAVALLSVLIFASSFLGLLALGRNYSIDNVQQRQQSVRLQLSKLKDKISRQLTLVDRVNKIQSIMKNRSLLVNQITNIQKQIPQDLQIQSLQISKTSMILTVSSSSLVSLKTFIDSLTSVIQKKSFIKKLTIDNVVVDTSIGVYTVNVTGVLQ